MKVSDKPLHTLKVHEAGCLVAAICEGQLFVYFSVKGWPAQNYLFTGGNVALLELAEGLPSAHRNDKISVTALR